MIMMQLPLLRQNNKEETNLGEAKRRALARKLVNTSDDQVILSKLSAALRRLCTAASSHFGSDCYGHASIAQEILARLGLQAKIIAGYAAWRVGNGDSDVIIHAPMVGMVPQPGGVAYHVWLEVADNIVDFTSYQLRAKAAQLDALDGGTTTVIWCPDYLFVPKKSISSLRDVTQLKAGMYNYSREPEVEARIIQAAPEMDINDVQAAWLLYHNQELQVFGPNNMDSMRE